MRHRAPPPTAQPMLCPDHHSCNRVEVRVGLGIQLKNLRSRLGTGQGTFPRLYPRKIPGIIANLAEFGRKPASRLGSDPEKLMIPLSFVIYHTTLCSYHTTPQENQISGKYHSFTSKWPSLRSRPLRDVFVVDSDVERVSVSVLTCSRCLTLCA